jgi:hypothetical protein
VTEELRQACALVTGRAAAEQAVERLAEAGIEAVVEAPGERYHGIGEDRWEVRVPATQVARARVLLS